MTQFGILLSYFSLADGMYAFVLEETGQYSMAEKYARSVIQMKFLKRQVISFVTHRVWPRIHVMVGQRMHWPMFMNRKVDSMKAWSFCATRVIFGRGPIYWLATIIGINLYLTSQRKIMMKQSVFWTTKFCHELKQAKRLLQFAMLRHSCIVSR